ncbi:MAG: putative membrane protein YhiD involved in acid resistance [Flavobacteriales bacterium]|jgi:uncharacterized membrane protein YhiD involved in acid resistance
MERSGEACGSRHERVRQRRGGDVQGYRHRHRPEQPRPITAQIESGVGFLKAGMMMKSECGRVTSLTTPASPRFLASFGMAIGFGWHYVAAVGTVFALLLPRIPYVSDWRRAK